jgi:protease I
MSGARKRKCVAVLVEDLYQDLEVWYPMLRLREAGYEVMAVGSGRKTSFVGKYGYPVQADVSAEEVRASDLDGVVVPGGYAPDILRRYDAVNALVREMDQEGRLVASICHGAWVLISAGVLKGRRMTCFSAIRDDVVNAGALFEDLEVVRDGHLVTSRTPEDLPAFLRSILEVLGEVSR